MNKFLHFKPSPEIYNWLSQKASMQFRSVPSVARQILAEKYNEEVNKDINKAKQMISEVDK